MTVAEYRQRARLLAVLYGATPPSDPAAQDQYKREAAKAMATSDALRRAANERGIFVTEGRIRAEMDKMVRTQFGPGRQNYARYLDGLRTAGVTEVDVHDATRHNLTVGDLYERVTGAAVAAEDKRREWVQLVGSLLRSSDIRYADPYRPADLYAVSSSAQFR